jgi:hypothetical protein
MRKALSVLAVLLAVCLCLVPLSHVSASSYGQITGAQLGSNTYSQEIFNAPHQNYTLTVNFANLGMNHSGAIAWLYFQQSDLIRGMYIKLTNGSTSYNVEVRDYTSEVSVGLVNITWTTLSAVSISTNSTDLYIFSNDAVAYHTLTSENNTFVKVTCGGLNQGAGYVTYTISGFSLPMSLILNTQILPLIITLVMISVIVGMLAGLKAKK